MGPNGSGKSTLGLAIAGHPHYTVTAGDLRWQDKSILQVPANERAKLGIFLAFQAPVSVPGVSVYSFLRAVWEAQHEPFGAGRQFVNVLAFRNHVKQLAEKLAVPTRLLTRDLNDGFSGGERKQIELLQLALLQPQLAIIDEIDSGLDIDALRQVATHLYTISRELKMSLLIITHHQRLLEFIPPQFVHVLKDGQMVAEGDAQLARQLEATGYHMYGEETHE
jgi:Fe-S cluster assembly ATP-binding protein